MANFHVDSSGNLWLGDTSTTFATSAPFYVTSAGAVKASSGTVGGIDLASDHIKSSNYSNTSGSEAGFKIDSNGDAFFNKVDIRIGGAVSQNPATGFTTLDIGSAKISEYDDRLWINAHEVMVFDGDATASATNPSLHLFGTYAQPGWYVDDSQVSRTKLMYTSGSAVAFHTESDRQGLFIDGDIYFGNSSGSSSQYIGKDSNGSIGWHDLTGGTVGINAGTGIAIDNTNDAISVVYGNTTNTSSRGDHDHGNLDDTHNHSANTLSTGHNHNTTNLMFNNFINNNVAAEGHSHSGDSGLDDSHNHTSGNLTTGHNHNTTNLMFNNFINNNVAAQGHGHGNDLDNSHNHNSGNLSTGHNHNTNNLMFNNFINNNVAAQGHGHGNDLDNSHNHNSGNLSTGHNHNTTNIVYNNTIFNATNAASENYVNNAINSHTNQFASGHYSSDRRFKENIQDTVLGLDFLNRLTPREFDWTSDYLDDLLDANDQHASVARAIYENNQQGFIVDEVKQAVFDETGSNNSFSGITYLPRNKFEQDDYNASDPVGYIRAEDFIPPLVKAVQELSAKVDVLEARIDELENP